MSHPEQLGFFAAVADANRDVVAGETTGKKSAQLPDEAAVARLSGLMSLPHRVLRPPLRGAKLVVADDARYQDVIVPYWQRRLKAQKRLAGVGSRTD